VYTVEVVYGVVSGPAAEDVGYGGVVWSLVTGQTVVYNGIVTVVSWGPAGQLVTVGAHDVLVMTEVVYTVEVVYSVVDSEDDSDAE